MLQTKMDYKVSDIALIERFLATNSHIFPKDDINSMAECFGFYIGQIIIYHYGGTWVRSATHGYGILTEKDAVLYPPLIVTKKIISVSPEADDTLASLVKHAMQH